MARKSKSKQENIVLGVMALIMLAALALCVSTPPTRELPILVGLAVGTVFCVFCVLVTEAMRKSLKLDRQASRKEKPSTLAPPTDDIEPTYRQTNDGEVMEVIDDEAPPALSFKVNDQED